MDQQDVRTDRWFEPLLTVRARLVRLCARLTGNRDVAEDLAQETLLAAWRQRHSLRDQERFSHWLSGIARNVCLSWARSRSHELAHTVEQRGGENQGDLEEVLADDFDLEFELERKELAELLDRALALLPPETRAVLIERYIEESPLAEIAAHLGLPLSTTAKRVQRGKLAFRRVLTTDLNQELAPSLTLIGSGLSRRDLFLAKGNMRAPSRMLAFIRLPIRWTRLGPILIVLTTLPLAIQLTLTVRPDFALFQRALPALPVILSFAIINAAQEEFRFRMVFLARLAPVMGARQALLLTSVLFGVDHWFGHPSGPTGVVLAGLLGWFLGTSMLETRGVAWAWLIHGVQDVVIMTFLVMTTVLR